MEPANHGRVSVRKMSGKDIINSDAASGAAIATLSRWSSEPASLSICNSDDTSPAPADLLERTRRLVTTLRQTLAAERDRCRRLQAHRLIGGPQQTSPSTSAPPLQTSSSQISHPFPSSVPLDAILRYFYQERCSDSSQLHRTVLRQHKTIVKLRRQLRTFMQLRTNVDDCSIASDNDDKDDVIDDDDDDDDSMSDFEMVCAHPLCDGCRPTTNDCCRKVRRNWHFMYHYDNLANEDRKKSIKTAYFESSGSFKVRR